MLRFLLAAILALASAGAGAQTCTTTLSAGANIASAISSAAAGSTICLNSGSYSEVSLVSVSKASTVTVRSTSGVGASVASLSVWGSNRITFANLSIPGGAEIFGGSTNITISGSTITGGGQISINVAGITASGIIIDGNTIGGYTSAGFEGTIFLQRNPSTGGNAGITISNNTFNGGSCADGIQIGDVSGVTVGPGNKFLNWQQGSCSAHVDAIQLIGSDSITITGNYFSGNTINSGIYDGGSNLVITNNVYDTPNGTGQHHQIGGVQTMLMEHNTFKGNTVATGTKTGQSQNSSWTVRNNLFVNSDFIAAGDQPGCGSGCALSYNLKDGNSSTNPTGTNTISGSPTFTGGASPATWAGWQLTSGSLGRNAGSDGKDVGTLYYGAAAADTGAPTAPTSPSATANSGSQITVSWTSSVEPDGDTITYNVRRCTGAACTPSTIVQSTTSTSWANSGLSASTLYRYTIDACDSIPNCSSQTSIVQATTNAPSNYTVTPSVTLGSSHGSISPNTAQTVTEGNTQAFTVAPNGGYQAIMGGTCGGSLVSTTYTTNAVTANCSVIAWFAPTACELQPSSGTFDNTPLGSTQTGTFTYNFSVIPAATTHDIVGGLTNGSAAAYTDFATGVLFSPSGVVQARNGGSYTADVTFNYSINTQYNIRQVVNRASHIYSVWVAQDGNAETQIANNYAFRTDQATVAQLNNFAYTGAPGATTGAYVCPLGLSTLLSAPINLRWSPL